MGLPARKSDRIGTPAHQRAPNMEREIAQRLGGRRVKGSGCGREKGDARVRMVTIDCKATKHKSFRITTEMVEKLEDQAMSQGDVPVFSIEFVDDRGNPTHRLAVIPDWALDIILKGGGDASDI